MGKQKQHSEQQLQSEFNMSVADLQRMDETLKEVNRVIILCSKFEWKKELTYIYSGLRIIYETMRPVANDKRKEEYDDKLEEMRIRLYDKLLFNRNSYEKLLTLYRDLLTLRQRLGFGVKVSSNVDWTDELAAKGK